VRIWFRVNSSERLFLYGRETNQGFKGLHVFGRKGLTPGQAAPSAPTWPAVERRAVPRDGSAVRPLGQVPDEPADALGAQEPVDALLARGAIELAETKTRLTAIAMCQIGAVHLLPVSLWHGRFGQFLLGRLDLSPYKPWNTIFLPRDASGALDLDLPIAPSVPDGVSAELETNVGLIAELFQGRGGPEVISLGMQLQGIRSNLPDLFPQDRSGLSDAVRQARANIRALALLNAASGLVDAEVIIRSHDTFLAEPETQLVE